MEYILTKPYSQKDKYNFIVKYNHQMGLDIVYTNGGILARSPIETEDEKNEKLRLKREQKCFPIINRGQLWYKKLTQEQINELDQWYNDWLNITETKVEPTKPMWLN